MAEEVKGYFNKKHAKDKFVEPPALDIFGHPISESANRHPGTGEISKQVPPGPDNAPKGDVAGSLSGFHLGVPTAAEVVADKKAAAAEARADHRAEDKAEAAKEVRDAVRAQEEKSHKGGK